MNFSVLMTVYKNDNEINFANAINSIWDQSLRPNQIVLVVDGPVSNKIIDVIKKWKDELKEIFSVTFLSENSGLAHALNVGLKECKYDYVARMDSDDLAFPDRFEIQMTYLKDNPDVAMVGGMYNIYDSKMNKIIDTRILPESFEEIKEFSQKRTPINHPTIIFKKEIAMNLGGYPEEIGRFEDWGFALKFINNNYIIINLNKFLVKFRGGDSLLSRRGGFSYMIEEIKALNEMKKLNLLTFNQILKNLIVRVPIRLIPTGLREQIYKLIRKGKK